MAGEFDSLLTRLISQLDPNTVEARQGLYSKAKVIVAGRLLRQEPPVDAEALLSEQSKLQDSIDRVESQYSKPPFFGRILPWTAGFVFFLIGIACGAGGYSVIPSRTTFQSGTAAVVENHAPTIPAAELISGLSVEQLSAKYSIAKWVTRQELTSNPFVYKDKNVGIQGFFVQMLTESDGLFDNLYCLDANRCEPVVVANVPTTAFSRGSSVALIVKALGMRTLKAGGQDVSLPHFSLVAYETCSTAENQWCIIGAHRFDRWGAIYQ